MVSKHLVLAGDSIFDNDGYVLGDLGVIEQLRRSVPKEWSCSKVAVDGDCMRDVARQIADLPSNTTDLIVSVGGNDVLSHASLLSEIGKPKDLDELIEVPLRDFEAGYKNMLAKISGKPVSAHVCTVYTAIPFEDPVWCEFVPLALNRFNQVIEEEASCLGIPVLRLDKICVEPGDFSAVSPIEPSSQGGQKIVDHIVSHLTARS